MYLFLYGMACRVRYASYSCNLTWFLVSKILCFIRLSLSKFQAQLGVQPTGLGGLVDGVTGQAAARQKGFYSIEQPLVVKRKSVLRLFGTLEGIPKIAQSLRNSPPDCFSQICCSRCSPNLEPPRRHEFHIAPNHFCLYIRQK